MAERKIHPDIGYRTGKEIFTGLVKVSTHAIVFTKVMFIFISDYFILLYLVESVKLITCV